MSDKDQFDEVIAARWSLKKSKMETIVFHGDDAKVFTGHAIKKIIEKALDDYLVAESLRRMMNGPAGK